MAATGLPPGILFAPEDEVAVEHYLLPRLLGWPLQLDGLVLDDDPLSAPPQELLERNDRKEQAFFFAEGKAMCSKGTRQKRTCAGGGWWEAQKACAEGDKLQVPGGGEAAWRKKALNFHCGGGGGKRGSTGWVMHEYAVIAPEDLARSPLRLCHIRLSSYGRKQSGAMEVPRALGFPPGFLFAPEDGDAVAHYLLPRVLGQPLPLDGLILDDDPLSAPPWKLLERNGRKEDAFFFALGQAKSGKGSRQKRTCAGGGFWNGERICIDGVELRAPGLAGGAWRKKAFSFQDTGEKGSTGWVMHEYAISAPDHLAASQLRLYRLRFSGHGRKRKREEADDEAAPTTTQRRVAEDAVLDMPSVHPICSSTTLADQANVNCVNGAEHLTAAAAFSAGKDLCSGMDSSGICSSTLLADQAEHNAAPVTVSAGHDLTAGGVDTSWDLGMLENFDELDELMKSIGVGGYLPSANLGVLPAVMSPGTLLDMPSLRSICSSMALADQANVNCVNGAEHHTAAAAVSAGKDISSGISSSMVLANQAEVNRINVNGAEQYAAPVTVSAGKDLSSDISSSTVLADEAEFNCINVNGAEQYTTPVTVSAGHDLTTGGIDTSWDLSILENFDEIDELMRSIADGGDLPSANPGVLPAVMGPGACLDADSAVSSLLCQAAAYPGVGTGLLAPSTPGMYHGCMEPSYSFFVPVPNQFNTAC